MFSSLTDIFDLDNELNTNVAQHLKKLECEFKSYFSELSRDDLSFARNLFRLSSEKIENKLQDHFIEKKHKMHLKLIISCQDAFKAFLVIDFWLRIAVSYPEISKTALKKLLPISSI